MRRIIYFAILVFIVILSFNAYAYPIGDVDGNGSVNSIDYILVRKHILKKSELSGDSKKRADVDGKNGVTSADYIIIRKIILGLYSPAPTEISGKKLSAKFINSDTSASSETTKEVSCMAYDDNGCEINVPNLSINKGYQFLGWNTSSTLKWALYSPNNKLLLKEDTTLYAIVPKIITITFNVSDNVDGKNIKAEKFAFTYTDINGNTVIENEGKDNFTTTCLSFNNEGCKIYQLPVIYAKGYMVHGYSKTLGGKNMSAPNTVFKEDTTIYARVGYYNSIKVGHANIGYQKLYGNVMLEIENGVSKSISDSIINTIEAIYKYYPEVLHFNGKIFILNENTYNQVLSNVKNNVQATAGHTITTTNYSNVFVKCAYSTNDILGSLVHEIGHAFDDRFGRYFSDREDLTNLYNNYKSKSNRPFRDYTYTNAFEFYADTFSGVMTRLIKEKTGNTLYTKFDSMPNDVRNLITSTLTERKNELKYIGLIK